MLPYTIVPRCQPGYLKTRSRVFSRPRLSVDIKSSSLSVHAYTVAHMTEQGKLERHNREGLREIRKEKECEGREKGWGGQGEMRERDVIYVWSRFTPSSPYHETSPGSDNHTADDVYVCESVQYNSLWAHPCLCVSLSLHKHLHRSTCICVSELRVH